MTKHDLIPYQREASALLAQFPGLPKESQRQIRERVAHIIAVAIVGQIGVQANTAMYLEEAGKALQMAGTYHVLSQLEPYLPLEMRDAFTHAFADTMETNAAIRAALTDHILAAIRSLQLQPQPQPVTKEDGGGWEFLMIWKLFGRLDEEV